MRALYRASFRAASGSTVNGSVAWPQAAGAFGARHSAVTTLAGFAREKGRLLKMVQGGQQTVLFLCTGNAYRGRFAEILFNSVAARMGLPWRATSRSLALKLGITTVEPMPQAAVEALRALGIRAAEACARAPAQAALADLENAALAIALERDEHRPLLQEGFPAFVDRVEFWQVAGGPEESAWIEQQVMRLIARLFGGGARPESAGEKPTASPLCPKCKQPSGHCICGAKPTARRAVVKVGRETKGRRGKGVTTVWDIPLDEAGVRELAATLKDRCGTGGTVKDGRIEIQGDQRDRVAAELEKLGYQVKRVGG